MHLPKSIKLFLLCKQARRLMLCLKLFLPFRSFFYFLYCIRNLYSQQKKEICPILGDGSIDVRDDDLVIPAPQVDGALAATRSLVLSGYAERDVIWSVSQFQAGLPKVNSPEVEVY